MTGLLASVRDYSEAQTVLELSVDVLDLKDPADGALGALDISVIRQIVALVAKRAKVSATAGNLPTHPEPAVEKIRALMTTGVDFVKIGFFSPVYLESYPGALRQLASQIPLVGVLFADRLVDFEGPCTILKQAGFAGVMLDTADKGAGGIRSLLTRKQQVSFIKQAHDLSLFCGVAGSLKQEDVKPLAALEPDYLGFRTALCANNLRSGSICVESVKKIKSLLEQANQQNSDRKERVESQPDSSTKGNVSGHTGKANTLQV